MDKRVFRYPIVIYTGHQFHLVSSVSEASDFLFDHWVEHDCKQWREAIHHCADFSMGITSVEQVKSAFLDAVKAAGLQTDPAICFY